MNYRIILIASIVLSLMLGCGDDNSTNPEPNKSTVKDIDGNVYKTVKICNQWWIAENLNVSHYRNGDLIPQVTNQSEWYQLTTGAWCYYNNAPAMGANYGKLYNWYAVNDPRGLAPDGWHIPTDAEWTQLTDCLGGNDVAGGKMKRTGTIEAGDGLWFSPNEGATNESGFSALPGGMRDEKSTFYDDDGRYGYWWSSTEYDTTYALFRTLYYDGSILGGTYSDKGGGFSIRCVKD